MKSPELVVPLICPLHGDELLAAGSWLEGRGCGTHFPIADGIPVLLPLEAEREKAVGGDWSQRAQEGSAFDFYNQTCDHQEYCRESLEDIRSDLARWTLPGPVLEIGSGRGALQGIGDPYVALDYSFTALKAYIDPRYQRVCASADVLPFPASTFVLVYTIATLEHVPHADRAFAEVARVLRPGGMAYLLPAWHCIQENCEGIPVRPYSELRLGQKLKNATLPFRQSLPAKALRTLPQRLGRRALWFLNGARATELRFGRLRPDYDRFWMSDSDAVARLDSHEACLFFASRGYDVLQPGPSAWAQLMARHHAVVVRKPADL